MNYFDFNYQNEDYVPFSRRQILPGDRLITTCVWDTSSDTSTVRGGVSSNNEMCIQFLEYYPVMPLFNCGQIGETLNFPNVFECLKMYPDGTSDGEGDSGFLQVSATDFPAYRPLNSTFGKCSAVVQLEQYSNQGLSAAAVPSFWIGIAVATASIYIVGI